MSSCIAVLTLWGKSIALFTAYANLLLSSLDKEGWPGSMYGVSKLCEATYSRCLAQQLAPKSIDVNACCPGICCLSRQPPLQLSCKAMVVAGCWLFL